MGTQKYLEILCVKLFPKETVMYDGLNVVFQGYFEEVL